LHIAAWLHDCGKITTPEYVVDKATKLETLNDRIHEIRTRVEVLKRDVVDQLLARLPRVVTSNSWRSCRDSALAELDDDFAFIARCNLGGEAMAEADLQRLRSIGQRTWTRTLDDRLGVSWEENRRQARTPAPTLPVSESLLADKPEHLFERAAAELIAPDNPFGLQARCAALQVQPRRTLQPEHYPRHPDERRALHHQSSHGADDPDAQPPALPRAPAQRSGDCWWSPRKNGRHRLSQTT
jgi:hypothetical protein